MTDSLDPFGFVRDVKDDRARAQIKRLAELRARNAAGLAAQNSTPKHLHQIWLGSPLPKHLQTYVDSWRRLHPQWEYTLWDDGAVSKLDFGTRDLFERTSCFGQKSDLLRVELLDRFGGVYVDTDVHAYQPLDELSTHHEFFAGTALTLQPYLGWPQVWYTPLVVSNSLVGGRAGHPIWSAYLKRVREVWDKVQPLAPGELPRVAIWAMGGARAANHIKQTGLRTYLPFHETVVRLAGESGRRDLVLGPKAFHPRLSGGVRSLLLMPQFWRRVIRSKTAPWHVRAYDQPDSETFADHVSTMSWLSDRSL